MRGKQLLIFAMIFLMAGMVSATPTVVNIKTVPDKTVFVNYIQPKTIDFQLMESFDGKSDFFGKFSAVYDVPREDIVDILIIIKDGSNTMFKEEFEGVEVGDTLEVEYFPEGYVDPFDGFDPESADVKEVQEEELDSVESNNSIVSNKSIVEESVLLEKEEVKNDSIEEAKITGNSVFSNISLSEDVKKIVWYSIIGLLAFGIVLFVSLKMMRAPKSSYTKNVSNNSYAEDYQKEINEAEKRIKEAQEGLNKLRNQSKIIEAEKKLEQDRIRLERLKNGLDD